MSASAVTQWLEPIAVVCGLIYVVLIVRQRRAAWVLGGVSSAIYIYISVQARLPMQAALQAYYVAMAVYGWYRWGAAAVPQRVVRWPWQRHAACSAFAALLAWLCAHTLAVETGSAWPRLDSLATVVSLLATWLLARKVLENWLYWLVVDTLSAYLFYIQGNTATAGLFLVYSVVAVVGYRTWRKDYQAQQH